MLLGISLVLFGTFILFHLLYTFIPLYTLKPQLGIYPIKEKGISILIPAFNEMLVIENCLQGILNVHYKEVEVLFINDGSTDSTLATLDKLLSLYKVSRSKSNLLDHETIRGIYHSNKYPHIWVIDKENGGKADALNAGIDFAKNEIIITLDADSIMESNALKEINRTFMDDSIVAAGGMVNIAQGFRQSEEKVIPSFKVPSLIRYQIVQYLTAFYLHKATQSKFGSMTVIAGAFGAFRRSILIQANG